MWLEGWFLMVSIIVFIANLLETGDVKVAFGFVSCKPNAFTICQSYSLTILLLLLLLLLLSPKPKISSILGYRQGRACFRLCVVGFFKV